MKRLLASLCLVAPLTAHATDDRLSYKNLAGGTSYAGLVTPVCGIGSSGDPISCVQGAISTSGSSIQIPFGTSGLYAKFAYTGSGSASMSFYATTGTLSPVDIRRNSIWGGSGVETYTLDNGSVSTTGVVADSTVYTA